MTNIIKIFAVSVPALLLTACGGGGGGGGGGGNANGGTAHVTPPVVTSNAAGTGSATATDGAKSEGSGTTTAATGNSGSSSAAGRPTRSLPASSGVKPGGATPVSPTTGTSTVITIVPAAGGGGSGSAPPTSPAVLRPSSPSSPSSSSPAPAPAPASSSPASSSPATSHGRTSPKPVSADYDGYLVASDAGFYSVSALSRNTDGSSGSTGNLFSVAVESDNNVVVTLYDSNSSVGSTLKEKKNDIKALKDLDGTLLGYYGWVTAVSWEQNRNGSIEEVAYPQMDIFYAINNQKSQLPVNNDVQYAGTFQYAVKTEGGLLREATATFHYKDKKIDGSITRDVDSVRAAHWIVDGDKTVDEEDATFNIRLKSLVTTVNDGTMQGGFFGKEGQIMAAKAESVNGGSRTNDEWAGVFVGTQIDKTAGQ